MNIIKTKVIRIDTKDEISIIKSTFQNNIFSAMVLDLPEDVKAGCEIQLIFKENEVMLASCESKVSARNAFIGNIIDIEIGEILCIVSILFYDIVINSIITKEACEYLGLEISKDILWCVKSNEVSIRM